MTARISDARHLGLVLFGVYQLIEARYRRILGRAR